VPSRLSSYLDTRLDFSIHEFLKCRTVKTEIYPQICSGSFLFAVEDRSICAVRSKKGDKESWIGFTVLEDFLFLNC